MKEKVPPLCKFLRTFGVDELPQLINVIKGEMSLVGPRPLDHFDLDILKSDYPLSNFERSQLTGKPGIIGFWQIKGKRALGVENLLYWDKLYNEKQSLRYDLQIMFWGLAALSSKQKEDSILSASPVGYTVYDLSS